MIVDTSPAFAGRNQGLSIWPLEDGRFQANVKRPNGGWMIGYGMSPQAALDDVWRNAAPSSSKPAVTKRRRTEDLI